MFRVKICGITTVEDALTAAEAGADAIGLNFYAKSARCVSVTQAAAIASETWLKWFVQSVGVFVNHSIDDIAAVWELDGMVGIQLHGDESPDFAARVSELVPKEQGYVFSAKRLTLDGIAEFKGWLPTCQRAGARIDGLLVDSHVAGVFGGSGKTAPWGELSNHTDWLGEVPLILAGGLTPDNVAEAIRIVQPAAVDVASGVESAPGKKDPAKVRDFVANALGAFAALKQGPP